MKNELKVIRCGLCKKPMEIEGLSLSKHGGLSVLLDYLPFTKTATKKLTNKIAVAWGTFGFSIGGWGRRQDLLNHGFSDEICEECFDLMKKPIDEFKSIIESRKNINAKMQINFDIKDEKSKSIR